VCKHNLRHCHASARFILSDATEDVK